ncbi:MAG: hypothetical protein ACOYL6_00180 [Bacteriovoracaceae bacterium]
MLKKFKLFKINGISSISRYHQCLFVLTIIVSNLLFYSLVLSPSKTPAPIQLPAHYTLVQLEARKVTPWEKGKKISLYDDQNQQIVEEAYYAESDSETLIELYIAEKDLLKVIGRENVITILPHQITNSKGKSPKIAKENIKEDDHEILF